MSNFKDLAPLTYKQSDKDILFSILPEDVYVALNYISKVLSYYVQLDIFEDEEYLFNIYNSILEETLENPIGNKLNAAWEVILKVKTHLGNIPSFYTMPNNQNIRINFFSESYDGDNNRCISFFKLRNKYISKKYIEEYGEVSLGSGEMDNGAIRLILYLATILQIEQAVNIKPFFQLLKNNPNTHQMIISNIKFLDKRMYTHLLFSLPVAHMHQKALHCMLRHSKDTL